MDEPVYSEPEQSVRLLLKNNIVMRKMRQSDRAVESIGTDMWHGLDDLEKEILSYMGSKTTVTRAELCDITGKSNKTITGRLNNLMYKELVKRNGNKYDPTHTYSIIE